MYTLMLTDILRVRQRKQDRIIVNSATCLL